MNGDVQVRPAVYVGAERLEMAPAPKLAAWERDLIGRLELEWDLHLIESMHPNETISGSGDGWDDCDAG